MHTFGGLNGTLLGESSVAGLGGAFYRRVGAGSVLEWADDRKNRVVSPQATYPCGSSAVGGRVCEERYAAERVLPESRFELQHGVFVAAAKSSTTEILFDRRTQM